MSFKLIPFLTLLLTIGFAYPYSYQMFNHKTQHESSYPSISQAISTPVYKESNEHKSVPVYYDFSYNVYDEHTKDIKNQKESRRSDMVKGYYDMIEPDGFKRVVDYTADDKNGFQAMVHHEKSNIIVPIPSVPLPNHNTNSYKDFDKNDRQVEYHHNYNKNYDMKYVNGHENSNENSGYHYQYQHNMPHLLHYTDSTHKPDVITTKNSKVDAKYFEPITKYIPEVEYRISKPKYVESSVQKMISPIETPVHHYTNKFLEESNASDHHAKTHVSFHGVHAKYEY